jgi:D-alanine-D-alanine ligase
VIVKPNFEGSSKGIDASAVVSDAQLVPEAVERALNRFPAGVIVEDFVAGRDISVAFLEPVGVLAAVEYEFADPKVSIYGYELKNERPEDVEVRAPARLELQQADELARAASTIFSAFSIRDVGRADFRLAEDGTLWFLEVNPLPSLEEGAGIYAAAALAGLDADGVIGAILDSAVRRRGDAVVR